MKATKKTIIALSCTMMVILGSCGTKENLQTINIPTAPTINTGSTIVMVDKKDLGQGYSLRNSKLYYGEEELVLSVMRRNIVLDIASIEPINYSFFKDGKYVYVRSVQDSATFDIVEGADPKTFRYADTGHSYEGIDMNGKYSFGSKVEEFSTGELNTASCQGGDCR